MFAGTLVGATLDWFSSLPEGLITSLEVFTRLFISILQQVKRNLWKLLIFLRLNKQGKSLYF